MNDSRARGVAIVSSGAKPTSDAPLAPLPSAEAAMDARRLAWDRDGHDWPNRRASRFVRAAGMRWHVQQTGSGPDLLLVHGTGSATHSWRDLLPALATHFRVTAPDLPGHGFSDHAPNADASLPAMSRLVVELMREMNVSPQAAVGHSAGAAILARAVIDGSLGPKVLISLNGAFLPFHGLPGRLFSPFARLLASTPFAARLMSRQAARPGAVERLLLDTGSRIDPRGVALYRRIVHRPSHVAGALAMMAAWDLHALQTDLPRLRTPLVLVVGTHDGTVPPSQAREVMGRVPWATLVSLPRLGHLAHEERPSDVAALIGRLCREHRIACAP